jgi:hypothetical protein
LPMVSLPFSLMMFRSHPSRGTSFNFVICFKSPFFKMSLKR